MNIQDLSSITEESLTAEPTVRTVKPLDDVQMLPGIPTGRQ